MRILAAILAKIRHFGHLVSTDPRIRAPGEHWQALKEWQTTCVTGFFGRVVYLYIFSFSV
jgi:hypothetical protein